MVLTAVSMVPWPVTMITGMSGLISRNLRSTSIPSISGMAMSSSASDGCVSLSSSIPSLPEAAVTTS